MNLRKRILFLAAAFLALGGLVLSALSLYFLWQRGPAEIDDSHLQIERVELPENENGFYLLEEALAKVDWPEARWREVQELVQGERPDEQDDPLAREVVEKNAAALAMIRAALERPLQLPSIPSMEDDFPYLNDWRRLGQLLAVEAVHHMKEGDGSRALDGAVDVVRFGHAIQDCGGTFLHYLVGISIKDLGWTLARRFAAEADLTPSDLKRHIEELAKFPANTAGLTNACKVEYQSSLQSFRDINPGVNPEQWETHSQFPVLHMPRTRQLLVESSTAFLKSIPQPFNKLEFWNLPPPPESTFKVFFSGNAVGETLHGLMVSSWRNVLARKCRENVMASATRTLLALRWYQLENGELPESIERLVPNYLEQVPIDDFDGEPLRYSAEKKLLGSAGGNPDDQAVAGANEHGRPLDILFAIDFLTQRSD